MGSRSSTFSTDAAIWGARETETTLESSGATIGTRPVALRRTARVLLIDDTPSIRELFQRILQHDGMAVVVAVDGLGGLAEAHAHPPDAIVCDLEMPRMGGLALCRALRADPATAHVPILVVSGRGATQADAALAAGCDAVLVKPCSAALLVATVRRLLVRSAHQASPGQLGEPSPDQAGWSGCPVHPAPLPDVEPT